MARRPDLESFGQTHGLKLGTIADLIRYRLSKERSVERIEDKTVETEFGSLRLLCYEDHVNRNVHLALVRGDLSSDRAPLVRVHLADTLRDVVGVHAPAMGRPLRDALQKIAEDGHGVLILLRSGEQPRDLIESVRALGSDARAPRGTVLRTYGIGAQILQDLGVTRMRVLSAPRQLQGLSAFGLTITEYVDAVADRELGQETSG
jgi:3,4-dihydroxy 2-butanone 4-phosphate synthase/GTP cyclohydrolase II